MLKRKKLLYSFIVTLFFLIIVLYTAVNSPRVIKSVLDKFAPNYHISYQRISGDLLNGLKIEDLKYKQKPLCQSLIFRWNPTTLLYKNLSVSKLILSEVHYQNLKTLYDDLVVNNENKLNEKNYFSFLIPNSINIAHFEVTVTPVNVESLAVEYLQADLKDIDIALDKSMVKSGNIDLNVKSNLADISYQGHIANNTTKGELSITALQKLIQAYQLPIRKGALNKVVVNIEASQNKVMAELHLSAQTLLDEAITKGKFNVDVQKLVSKATYDVNTNTFKAENSLLLSTPYANDITLDSDLIKEGQWAYKGQLKVGEWTVLDKNMTEPIEDFYVTYKGDMQNIRADITAKNLIGTINSEDMKHFDIHLGSINEVILSKLTQLPKELEATKFSFDLNIPWVMDSNMTQAAEVKLRSNITDIDANITFDKQLKIKAQSMLPKSSLLKEIDDKVNWDTLSDITIDSEFTENNLTVSLETKEKTIWLKGGYGLQDRNLTGEININGLQARIHGALDKNMIIDTHVSSFQEMFNSLQSVYHFEALPQMSGSADVSAKIEALKTVDISLVSPHILYKADTQTTHTINSIQLAAKIDKEHVNIDHYKLNYDDVSLFSNKSSVLLYQNNLLKVEPLWINDSMKVEGSYDFNITKGTFTTQAKNFPIRHQYAHIDADTDITIDLDGNATTINGSIIILDGKILYDLMQKTFPSDSDVIIIQKQKTQKQDTFMDNLSINLLVESKKPLVYQKPPIDMQMKIDGSIYKAVDSPLLMLGMVKLLKGGSYMFQDKKFILNDSYIYFSGDINKPILELGAEYDAPRHRIKIDVKGTPNNPNIRFSSIPSLTKEEILSVILFGSKGGSGSYSSDDMMRMMGGVMAKSVLSQFGVNIDILNVGEGSSVEVGKKLNEDVTVIYINDEVPKVELRYKHNDRFESVVGTSSQSSSYDIFYKKDY